MTLQSKELFSKMIKNPAQRRYYWKNRDLIAVKQEKRRTRLTNRFSNGRNMALRRDLEWSLSFDEYKSIVASACYYCGCDLSSQKGHSLDRKDNSVGYTKENVIPCCGGCNVIRNDQLTVEEMKVAMDAVNQYRSKIKLALVKKEK